MREDAPTAGKEANNKNQLLAMYQLTHNSFTPLAFFKKYDDHLCKPMHATFSSIKLLTFETHELTFNSTKTQWIINFTD